MTIAPMTNTRLRSATDDDVPELIQFWSVAGENTARPVDRTDLVRRLITYDPEALVIAEIDGVIVGTVICGWDGWRGSLYRLAVSPMRRGEGIGTALVKAAEERLARLGSERYQAMLLDENELGHKAWTAMGYQRQVGWSRWVKPAPATRSSLRAWSGDR